MFLRRYFGEDHPPPCGTCDRCRADRVGAAANPFAEGTHADATENLWKIGRSQCLLTPLLDRAASQQQKQHAGGRRHNGFQAAGPHSAPKAAVTLVKSLADRPLANLD